MSNRRQLTPSPWRFGVILAALLLATSLLGCGDSGPRVVGTTAARCGDGFCLESETPETCPLDCPYECVPGTQRCAANAVLTCRDDGLSEQATFCANDEYCTETGCETSPGLTPDGGFPDIAIDPIDDLPSDVPFDFVDEATGTADQ